MCVLYTFGGFGLRKYRIAIVILTVFLLIGCEDTTEKSVQNNYNSKAPEYSQTVNKGNGQVTYEMPKVTPKVLVNQAGYYPDSTKKVIFNSIKVGETFEVIDDTTKEVVFVGKTVPVKASLSDEDYHSEGDFSELKTEGTYSIRTDKIGMSYPFLIDENVYDLVFYQVFQSFHKNADTWRDEESEDLSNTIGEILLSYEFYPHIFPDNYYKTEVGNGIPDILDISKKGIEILLERQDPKTGGIFAKTESQISNESTAAFAATLAKFYYQYETFDPQFAAKCLQASKRAYGYLEKQNQSGLQKELFYAATELYRATGSEVYHKKILSYIPSGENGEAGFDARLLGEITYLSTRRKVDIDFCDGVMQNWMNQVESIIEETKENKFHVAGEEFEIILNNMLYLVIVDHIISSHEYITVIENHLHYFLGCNEDAISYIENIGYVYPEKQEDTITNQMMLNAKFIFMLSELINKEA